jgi:cyclopropane-fatty-acyl-phospholipid synthase
MNKTKNQTPAPLSLSPRFVFWALRRMRHGRVIVNMPDGNTHRFGAAEETAPSAQVNVHDTRMFRRLLRAGNTGFAEAYMEGQWSTPDLAALLKILNENMILYRQHLETVAFMKYFTRILHALRPNSRRGAQRNIHAHYDLGNEFYRQWLDPSMTYSSALFDGRGRNLKDAQENKYKALAEQIGLGPDHHVLEIGCGWGGFAEYAARHIGCQVTGITISREQLAFGQKRIQASGLSDKVDLKYCDYRDVDRQYDRVVSIEMFEAVGEKYWPVFFDKLRACLKPGGRAGLQIITIEDARFETYRKNADFIQRYIFPGGMLPSPDKLKQAVRGANLRLSDQKDFAKDYAETLARWRQQFLHAWPDIQAIGFDGRFKNMWEYYLAYCEAGFSTGSIEVSHFTLDRPA